MRHDWDDLTPMLLSEEPGRRSRRHRLWLQPLERRSLSASFTPFLLPTTATAVANITKGPDGNLWFTVPSGGFSGGGQIGKMTTSGNFTFYALPPSSAITDSTRITAGPDGNLWFTDSYGKIGRITTSGQVKEFQVPLPPGALGSPEPIGITAGPDGCLWFTYQARGFGPVEGIGRITPPGLITEFPLPVAGLGSIVTGADGNLWFTHSGGIANSGIGKFTPAGVFTDYSLNSAILVYGITSDIQGNIWFDNTMSVSGRIDLDIGRITLAGQVQSYPLISGSGNLTSGGGLTTGQDGRLYLTVNDQVEQVTANQKGPPSFFQFHNPNPGTLRQLDEDITAGPDGNLWYTQQSFPAIVKLDVVGSPTPPPTPTPPSPTPTSPPTPTPRPTPTPTATPTPTPPPTPTPTPTPPPTPAPAPGPIGHPGGPHATRTTLTAQPRPGTLGRAVTFTATVEDRLRGSGTPAGSIVFLDGGASMGTVALRHGKATIKTSSLQPGGHAIRAVYAPAPGFDPSAASIVENVRVGKSRKKGITNR